MKLLSKAFAKSKPAGSFRRFGACLIVLVLLSITFGTLWAAAEPEEPGHEDSARPAGKLVAADDGNPQLTVSGHEDKITVFRVSPNAKITLNGVSVPFSALKPDDALKLVLDKDKVVTEISAERRVAGIVFATASASARITDNSGSTRESSSNQLTLTPDYIKKIVFSVPASAQVKLNGAKTDLASLKVGDHAEVISADGENATAIEATRQSMAVEFWHNFRKNLFKPLLLFFYMGFSVPLLKVAFEFPHIIYQGLTIYLLVSIGWKGGEELAELSGSDLTQALKFMCVGFTTNFFIGIVAFLALRTFVKTLRRIDAATVSAYYGSDSAGTFVTCVGVLNAANIAYAAFMPVMLAVMEIPGCLVGLFLVSRLRKQGMDPLGNMPDELDYNPDALPRHQMDIAHDPKHDPHAMAVKDEKRMALEAKEDENGHENGHKPGGLFSAELLREVFLNPGLFLLFGGILIGWVSRLQGHKVTDIDDTLFVNLFQGMLCLFLLEMGMTASKRLVDLKTAGWRFIVFGLTAPNIFAITGICVAHIFAVVTHTPLQLGTYALFAVLCGAASYIAVPAIQRLAIPEASPTLPLAASLGLTFSYNVTVGIPVYIMVAQIILRTFPVTT
jgi:hypothetical protein